MRLVPALVVACRWTNRRLAVTIIIVLALLWAPAVALAAVVVEKGPANIRSGPGTNHPIIKTAAGGERFEDLARQGDWFRIKMPDGKEGYIYAPLVRVESSVQPNTVAIPKGTMNLRGGPGTTYGVVGQVLGGTVLAVTARSGDWVRVKHGQGEAWLAAWLATVKTLDAGQFEAGDLSRKVIALKAGVRVRRGASEEFSVLTTLNTGAQATYLSSSDGWHRITTTSGATGWVDATDVRVINVDPGSGVTYEVGDNYWQMKVQGTGRAPGNVNIRRGPSTGTSVLGRLPEGGIFQVLGSEGGWYHIRYGSVTGYVAGWLVKIDPVKGPSTIRLESRDYARKVLTVTGDFPVAGTAPFDASKFGIVTAPQLGAKGRLDIYAGELGTVELGPAGILLTFVERPSMRVIESKAGRFVLELFPSVEKVAYEDGPRSTIKIDIAGYTNPVPSFDSAKGIITIELPGAALKAPVTLPAKGVILSASAAARGPSTVIEIKVAPGSQYNVRQSQNLIVVDVLSKGLQGKVICLDPGHGGKDPGAIGPSRAVMEKDPDLAISLRLKALLESRGVKVIMTRSTDAEGPDLASRVKACLDSRADLFVSIHNNGSTDRSKLGTTLYYSETSLNAERSKKLAETIQLSVCPRLGTQDNGARASELFVTRNAPVTAVVAELVFITNAREEQLLKDPAFLQACAEGLFAGLRQYFGD